MADVGIETLTASGAHREQAALVALLRNVVDDGGSVGFLPPLSAEEAGEYWAGVAAALEGGSRLLWVARDAGSAPSSEPSSSTSRDVPTAIIARR